MIRWVLVFITAFISLSVSAEKDFSSWRKFSSGELISETTALNPGSQGTVGFHVKLAPKWHTYWVNPGDSGAAIRLNFKNTPGLKVRQVLMPLPERIESGPLVTFGYSNEVLFLIELEISDSLRVGQTANIQLDAEWLVCEAVCIPAFDSFTLALPLESLDNVKPSSHFADFQKTRNKIPQVKTPFPTFQETKDHFELTVADWNNRVFVDFFPFRNSGVTNGKARLASTSPLKLVMEKGPVGREAEDRVGVLVSRNTNGTLEAWQFGQHGWTFVEEAPVASNHFLWMILFAFLGGLILNLMPCVFPILSIKLLSLLKLSDSQTSEVRRQNLAYVAGVLVSFLVIALLLSALRSAGQLVGWGFQLQSPVFLSLLSWLFFTLSLNLLGVFEIDFLNANLGNKLTRAGGMSGSFFTGVLAVVVASPCTAPFMGAALGFGLSQSTPLLFAIFLSLGLGLAFPYLLFAVFPRLIRILPKPGRWMNVVKQVMAFPMLLTTLWLIWILHQIRGINAVMIVLAGCLAIGFALWMSSWRKTLAKTIAGLLIVGGTVFIYRSEKQLGGQVQSDIWKPYTPALLESVKGQRVFVNMTADWCLTCKVNERLVFNDSEIMALFEAKKIVLIKGDWTQRNEDITRFLTSFGRVGVPFYVLYSPRHPQGQILPEVLTKSTFRDLILKEFPD